MRWQCGVRCSGCRTKSGRSRLSRPAAGNHGPAQAAGLAMAFKLIDQPRWRRQCDAAPRHLRPRPAPCSSNSVLVERHNDTGLAVGSPSARPYPCSGCPFEAHGRTALLLQRYLAETPGQTKAARYCQPAGRLAEPRARLRANFSLSPRRGRMTMVALATPPLTAFPPQEGPACYRSRSLPPRRKALRRRMEGGRPRWVASSHRNPESRRI